MTGPPRCLRLRHSPAGGAFGAVEAELDQTFVEDVGTDLALAAVDPLFDLRQVVVDEAWSPSGTGQCQPRVTGGDVAPDDFRIDTGQLRGGMRAAGRVVGFENFHDLPVRLLHASLRWESLGGGRRPRAKPLQGRLVQNRHTAGPTSIDREINCLSAGTEVSFYREIGMSAFTPGTPILTGRYTSQQGLSGGHVESEPG